MPRKNTNLKNLLQCKSSTVRTKQEVDELESNLTAYFQLLLEWQKQEKCEVQSAKA